MRESTDTYVEAKRYQSGKFHITILRPILTEEERARRMERVKEAAIQLMREKYEREAREQREKEAQKEEGLS